MCTVMHNSHHSCAIRPQAPVALFVILDRSSFATRDCKQPDRQTARSKAGTEQAHPLVRVRVFCLASRSLFRENKIIAPLHVPRPALALVDTASLIITKAPAASNTLESSCCPTTRGGGCYSSSLFLSH
jgi:hypothetical protein